jgi:hypothetical protein
MMPIVHHSNQNQIKSQKPQNLKLKTFITQFFLHNLNPQKPPQDMFQIKNL